MPPASNVLSHGPEEVPRPRLPQLRLRVVLYPVGHGRERHHGVEVVEGGQVPRVLVLQPRLRICTYACAGAGAGVGMRVQVQVRVWGGARRMSRGGGVPSHCLRCWVFQAWFRGTTYIQSTSTVQPRSCPSGILSKPTQATTPFQAPPPRPPRDKLRTLCVLGPPEIALKSFQKTRVACLSDR